MTDTPGDAVERARNIAVTIVDEMGADIGEDKVIWPETWRRRIAAYLAAALSAERAEWETKYDIAVAANNSLVQALEKASAERAEASRENEWLRRLLRWCRPRLKHASYQSRLDKSLAAGPTDALEDEPAMTQSALAAAPPGEAE